MRRTLRIAAVTLGSVLTLVLFVILAVLVIGNTGWGRRLIEQESAALTRGQVRLSGLSGSFPAAIDLRSLQLTDEHGVWLTADNAKLRWSPLALLARHVNVELIQVDRLEVERQPVTQPTPKKESQTPSVPRTDIHQLRIGTLILGPALAGTRASLSVEGNAHVVSLKDATARLVARRTNGNGDYEVSLSFDPARMDAAVKLQEPAGGTLENLLHYPGLGALSVSATVAGPRDAEKVQLTAQVGELQANVDGTVDLTRESAELGLRLESPALTPRPGLSWQSVSLHGQWHGTLQEPHAGGQLQIVGLQAPAGTELPNLRAEVNADRGTVALRATAEGLVIPGPQPKLFSDSPLHLDATIRLNEATRPLQLTAEHHLFSLQAHAVTTGTQSATFNLHLPEVAPFATLAGQNLHGQADLKGQVQQSGRTTRLDLDATSQLEAAQVGPAEPAPAAAGSAASGSARSGSNNASLVSRIVAGTSTLKLSTALTDQTVEVERLALNTHTLTVSASGSAQRGATAAAGPVQSLRARYDVNLSDLSVLAGAVGGTLKVTGQLEGPAKSLAADLQARADLSIRGSAPEPVEANIKARGLPSLASATVQAQGRLAGAPLHIDAAVDRGSGNTFHLVVHRTEWKSAQAEGDLTTAANLTTGRGTLQLRMDRLQDLESLLGTQLGGSVAAKVTLRPVDRRTYADLVLDAQNVSASNLSANAHLTAAGPTDALGLQLAVQSPNLGGEPASLDTGARLNLTARELHLQRLEMRYHGQSMRLLSPARIAFAQEFAIRQLKLGAQQAVVLVDGQISPALDLRASLRQVNSDLVNAFMPGMLAEGTLDADARLRGTSTAPSGIVTVKASSLRLGNSALRDIAAVNVQATAHLTGQAAQLDTTIDAGRDSRLTVKGDVPLNTAGAVNLKLAGKLQAAIVNPILEARGERAGGTLAVNAAVTGTAHEPQVEGTVDFNNGDLRDYAQGLHLANINAHLVGRQGVLQIASFTAHAAPGQITMTGTIGVLQPQMPIDIQLKASNAQPITSDILTANINADLKVNGTLSQRIDLTGTIHPKRAVIGIPGSLPPEVAVLDVRRPGEAPPPPPEHKLVIGLDLKIHAPQEILVQGRGLDAELGGDLRITGTTAAPQIDGGFDMIRGSFKLVSTTLSFTKGRVSFNGAGLKNKIDPTLDFTAQATTNDGTTATLHIFGLADSPQFDLSSSPQLPQDEILARLLFGESASQLTALQLAEIGSALASLSGGGGGGGLNPVAKVQKALGLDRLSIGGGGNTGGSTGQGSGGTTVEAGRYVTNRVYVGARESTTGASQVEVNVDVTKRLKLAARLGNGTANTQGTTPENDPGSSVGLVYQIEY